MKRILLVCFSALFLFTSAIAATININIVGFSYNPNDVTVNVGDVIIIQAEPFHPLVQVTQATWNANGNTPMPGGFNETSTYTFTVDAAMAGTSIFYVCGNHVLSGMKGRINVNVVAGISENRLREFIFTVYPNPVVADAWLNVSVKKAGRILMTMYDMQGRIVQQFVDMNVQPGEFTLPFKTATLQRGTYILQMRTTQGMIQKQISLQ